MCPFPTGRVEFARVDPIEAHPLGGNLRRVAVHGAGRAGDFGEGGGGHGHPKRRRDIKTTRFVAHGAIIGAV